MTGFDQHRDHYAGLLIAAIGAGAIYEGSQYGIGTLTNMGSGFFPVMLGVGMILMGALMAAMRPAVVESHGIQAPNWRGAAAIVGAVALFILLANRAGLAPATFCCVFVGALGTKGTKPAEAAILAAGVTVFGVILFRYGLQVQFPILRGVMQ
ncbi:MAG: tripartite tricarboxylate transporter TctB family protein [Janthinobacterium lividum]